MAVVMASRIFVLFLSSANLVASYVPNVDCTFENDLCGWKAVPSARLFHADAVPLGAAGSIRGDGKFVFIQSSSPPDESEIRFTSPTLESSLGTRRFDFVYWKLSPQTKIDVCIQNAGGPFRCVDTAPSEVTQRHWFTHSLVLPPSFSPFSIVVRVRNVHSASDIVALDNFIFEKVRPEESPKPGASFFPKDFKDLKIKQIRPNSRLPVNGNPLGRPEQPIGAATDPIVRAFPAEDQTSHLSVCGAIRCNFLGTKCSWRFDRAWRLQEGNIAIEGGGNGSAISEPFKVPVGAFFEMDLWVSNKTSIVVRETAHSLDRVIYSSFGLSHNGWHRVRVPIKPSYEPVELRIQAFLEGEGVNFATISRTRLVDQKGSEMPCETEGKRLQIGGAATQIRPNQTLQRLTALQSLKEIDVAFTKRPLSVALLPTMPPLGSFPALPQLGALPHPPPTAPPATLPPLSALFPPMANTLPPNSQIAALLTDPNALRSLLSSGSLPPSVNELVARFGSQPMLEGQLRQLAQRFGFANLSMEKALELFKQFTSSGPKSVGKAVHQPKSPLSDLPPIRPVNANDKDFEVVQKNDEIRPAPEQRLQSALTSRLSSFLKLPQAPDHQRPLQRKNLDFVIENAWKARKATHSGEVESERII
ncbi:hypothetical protein QR680_009062 [Steinernema hermaphroditum]|uniref:MAM domain-containing protein n=1 Tax=Steinernema hermaphroditum TaxID=289476 RepID=A0AA39IIV7_9BILA|nr:hypothetical protein QR680_009062 [Steinernema hermaphroditum]